MNINEAIQKLETLLVFLEDGSIYEALQMAVLALANYNDQLLI